MNKGYASFSKFYTFMASSGDVGLNESPTETLQQSWAQYCVSLTNVLIADANAVSAEVLSLSSGVGTSSSQSGSAGDGSVSLVRPGMHVVCVENYSSVDPESLHISQGDIVEGTKSHWRPIQ